MAIDITAIGAAGVHTLRPVMVNSEDNFIYFKDSDMPGALIDGDTYVYAAETGSVAGVDTGTLVYINKLSDQVLKFFSGQNFDNVNNEIDFTGSTAGGISLNLPVLIDGVLNIDASTPSNQAVKYFTTGTPLTGLVSGNTYFLRNVPADFAGVQTLYTFEESGTANTFTFASVGETGRTGPNQNDVAGGYTSGWHNTPANTYLRVEASSPGYQDWVVPVSGIYEFTVKGASGHEGTGSGTAGAGAIIKGRVGLTRGEIITIAVGQKGEAPTSGTLYGGSGGGSFVVRKQGTQPLFVAGGGSADANETSGQNGLTTKRGGVGFADKAGGVDGFGGPASDGRSAGGGGFSGVGFDGQDGLEKGGGSFLSGLTAVDNGGGRTGGNGGFGGGGSSEGNNIGQSGGAGGFSGGAGSRTTTGNVTGGAGGSFIAGVATNISTSDGEYEELSTFNGVAITDLDDYNTDDGSVQVDLVESFTSGNTVHPTALDAANNTNAIAIAPAGNSFHAFVPINYDIQNNRIHFTSGHGFVSGQAIAFNFESGTPDLQTSDVYYVNVIDDFSISLVHDPAVNFTTPTPISSGDVIREIVVNTDLDSINIPSHGFSVNQPVQYSSGGGDPIEASGIDLDSDATYYISEVVDQDNFKLKIAFDGSTPLNLTSPGTGTSHSFTFLTVNFVEDRLYIPSHNLVSGQAVSYTANGGTEVGGLTEGDSYFVKRVDASSISLHTSTDLDANDRVGLTSVGTGTHDLVIASINFATDTITIPAHGFSTGELVEYDARGQTPITGLSTNQQYYVILVNADSLKLAETSEDADDGVAINLESSPAGVGRHTLSSLQQTPDGIYTIRKDDDDPVGVPTPDTFTVTARGTVGNIVKTFNPRQTVDIELDSLFFASHGFITGTKVNYSQGANATDIGGLTDDTDYYVVAINQDYFRLATTLENALSNIVIDLTSFGSGEEHILTSNQLNGRKVGSGNVSVVAGSVLVDGVGTSFAKILKVGDPFILYPPNTTKVLTFADSDVNTGNNRIEIAHTFSAGDYVKFNAGGGTRPEPLQPDYYYYVGVINENAIQLFTSYAAALALTSPINFSSTGTGSAFTLTNTIPSGPIIRRITAVGSDFQVTVDRPYSTAYTSVAYAYPTFMYVRPSGFALHRPFDGGVEMSSGSNTWYGQIIRQTRKYFRYQSGKGIQTSFAITYKPSIDIESMTRISPTQVEVKTRRPHNLISSLVIQVAEAQDSEGAQSTLYNGNFVAIVDDLVTFRINAVVPTGAESKAYGFPQFHVVSWNNGAIRAGMFDFQNGMFFEFDGQKLYAVRRSSTQQTSGYASALRGSELVFGDKTQFTAQFEEGDSVVMRGQTYRIIDIQDDTTMSVRPEYRGSTGVEITFDPATQLNTSTNQFTILRHGLSQNLPVIYNSIDGDPIGGLINGRTYYADVLNANNFKLFATPSANTNVNISSAGTTNIHSFIPAQSGIILTKTVDTRIPQESWSIDKCDGTGPSGYDLDLSRIQMCYIDYSWYGAGKVRFGLKTDDGLVRYVHEFKHNNVLFESYFRSGNLPARYEVATFEDPTYVPSLFHWGTSVIMDGTFDDDRGYLFTAGSQTLDIEGTTTKSFAGSGIDLDTDLITSLTHAFRTEDIIEFQSIAADGLPGLNSQNPSTRIVGSNTLSVLENTTKYGILVNSADRIHLTPPNAKFSFGATVSRSTDTITVVTAEPHGIPNNAYVGIYGLTADNLVNGAFDVTVTNSTTFEYTVSGSETVSSISQPGAAIAEVIDFTTRGNVQYTFFLHPDGSLNNTTGPNYQPLISLRLSPSADSGLTGRLGDKDIINRMQIRMQEIGVSPDELVEVKLLLNGRLNNLSFTPVDPPSLVEIVEHTLQDTISGGIQIYNFQAEAGSTTTLELDRLFELSNSILGGDNVYPDGPDILTVAVSRLTGTPTRVAAKLSWLEAQA